jgi:hypothetical protein
MLPNQIEDKIMNIEDRVADNQTAQDLIDQAASNGLTKTELLAAIQRSHRTKSFWSW